MTRKLHSWEAGILNPASVCKRLLIGRKIRKCHPSLIDTLQDAERDDQNSTGDAKPFNKLAINFAALFENSVAEIVR